MTSGIDDAESIFGALEPWYFRLLRPIQDRGPV